jgi:hypothetical protein
MDLSDLGYVEWRLEEYHCHPTVRLIDYRGVLLLGAHQFNLGYTGPVPKVVLARIPAAFEGSRDLLMEDTEAWGARNEVEERRLYSKDFETLVRAESKCPSVHLDEWIGHRYCECDPQDRYKVLEVLTSLVHNGIPVIAPCNMECFLIAPSHLQPNEKITIEFIERRVAETMDEEKWTFSDFALDDWKPIRPRYQMAPVAEMWYSPRLQEKIRKLLPKFNEDGPFKYRDVPFPDAMKFIDRLKARARDTKEKVKVDFTLLDVVDPVAAPPVANPPPAPVNDAPLDKMDQDQEDDPVDNFKCMICFEATPNTQVQPCGHIVVCSDCSRKLEKTNDAHTCVRCRRAITSVQLFQ